MILSAVEKALQNFEEEHETLRGGLCASLVTFVFFLISLSSNYWLSSSDIYYFRNVSYTARYQGLWMYCQQANDQQCCGYMNEHIDIHGYSIPPHVNATRAFMVITLIIDIICLTVICGFLFTGNDFEQGGRRGCGLPSCLKALFIIIAVSAYGGSRTTYGWTDGYSFSWSFYLAITAMSMNIITTCIFCLDCCYCCKTEEEHDQD